MSFARHTGAGEGAGAVADEPLISQVMPPPTANKYPIVGEYQRAMRAAGVNDLSGTSLEAMSRRRCLLRHCAAAEMSRGRH